MDEGLQKAAFAAGCFWHVEADFRRLKGVKDVIVGYMGGHTDNPHVMRMYILVGPDMRNPS